MVGRWLARIGVASYSIYLVHLQILQIVVPVLVDHFKELPVLLLVATCVVCGLSTVMAISLPFYWLIERPWVALGCRQAPGRVPLTPARRQS
jgi:peptidoglycan/LPS O-acetylase OafA/YrhL